MSDEVYLVTPEMQKHFVRLKQQLEEHAACFNDVVHNLKKRSNERNVAVRNGR